MTKLQAIGMIFLMSALTAYGQIVMKWRISKVTIPASWGDKVHFLFNLLLSPWVMSSFFAAFLASLCWMVAISRLDLSFAYPFTGMNFILVLVLSALLFHEPLTWNRYVGLLLVILGIFISSRQ